MAMRTSVFILFLSALVAVGCNKASDSKPQPEQGGTPGGGGDRSGTPAEFAGKSPIEFIGTKPGGKHVGGFASITVALRPVPAKDEDFTRCKIDVVIDTDSLWSDTPKLTGHLKSPDFFDVKKYPTAKFVSKSIQAEKSGDSTHKITGDLTLHGTTKAITIPAKVAVTPEGVNIDSQFTINRHDFGISYGKGKINDEIQIKAAIKAALSVKK
jgi:polyisoprenoid-binding protein YceI